MSIFDTQAKAAMPSGDALPAGTHAAVLYAIVDIGTHEEEYEDKKKKKVRFLYYVWEVPAEKSFFGQLYSIIPGPSGGLSSKAALRKMLESWRGKVYQEGEKIGLLACLGMSCILTITHKQSGENSYPKMGGVSKLMTGMQPVQPSKPPFNYEIIPGPLPAAISQLPWCFCGGQRVSVDTAINQSDEREAMLGTQPTQQPPQQQAPAPQTAPAAPPAPTAQFRTLPPVQAPQNDWQQTDPNPNNTIPF